MPEDRKDRREKMAKEAKTNAMRMLDRQKVKYEAFSYECDEFIDGIHSADKIGAPYDQSFKTLVMEGKSGGYFVFVVPIEKEVDRKAAAKAVGEKTVDMIHVKDITKITGYVRGGCSPLGMKKPYPVVFDASAGEFEEIYVSGGRIGLTLKVPLADLLKVTGGKLANWIFAHFFHTPFISLVNLICGKEVVQELFGGLFTEERIEAELGRLMNDRSYRSKMLGEYEVMAQRLGEAGAARSAARLIYDRIKH